MDNHSSTNISKFDEYLTEFYGPGVFAAYVFLSSLFVIGSDVLFIAMTLTTPYLRSHESNWFLVGFSLADCLHCFFHVIDAFAIWFGSIENRSFCKHVGFFVVATASTSFGFPALIAADRYYKITYLPQNGSLMINLFTRKSIVPVIALWFLFAFAINIPLLTFDAFGEDPGGFCGARKFASVPLLLAYEFSCISIFAISMLMTGYYYIRLTTWLNSHQVTHISSETMNYTRAVMKLMKAVTIVPMVTATPAVILGGGQMLFPELPMWIRRALISAYFISSAANPWLTILLVRPFRTRFRQLFCGGKVESVTVSSDVQMVSSTSRQTRNAGRKF
uniref:G-protein coupled receptors family 1 profile domain-containing protein n=1 Tax=Plectus sambesii TaxID=2011161 RepID=A0A914W7U4_9BILA